MQRFTIVEDRTKRVGDDRLANILTSAELVFVIVKDRNKIHLFRL